LTASSKETIRISRDKVPGLANFSYEERLEAMDLPSLQHIEG